jgi:hypothetical protein
MYDILWTIDMSQAVFVIFTINTSIRQGSWLSLPWTRYTVEVCRSTHHPSRKIYKIVQHQAGCMVLYSLRVSWPPSTQHSKTNTRYSNRWTYPSNSLTRNEVANNMWSLQSITKMCCATTSYSYLYERMSRND